jgi:S-adenosyl methyltransferase
MEPDRTIEAESSGLSAARIYDYYLGGRVNSATDREAARLLMKAAPGIGDEARSNRAFLVRAVRELTELGIEQFLDIGAGIPLSPNVHEVASHARVVYADNDATALYEFMSAARDDPRIAVVEGDLRDPREILHHPRVADHLDLTRPVAILLVGVIHCIKDDEEARRATAQIRAFMPAGGFLVISHGTVEGLGSAAVLNGVNAYSQITKGIYPRSRESISEYFTDLELLEPGIVPVDEWRPDSSAGLPAGSAGWRILGGVGKAGG